MQNNTLNKLEHQYLSEERETSWHALDSNSISSLLDVDSDKGLTTAEVTRRRHRFGPNTVQVFRSTSPWKILFDQFFSVVIGLLAVAALLSAITGETMEAVAILVVLILNAIVGFATEWKAGKALEALRRQSRTSARVRRDRHEANVDAEELVPGDIVILNAGDRVPADARILEAIELQAEESALTGESASVRKSSEAVPGGSLLADRQSMVYLGTAISAGHALSVVVSTGIDTELGRIGKLVSVSTKQPSPLELRLGELGRRLVVLVIVIAFVVMVAGWLRGDNIWLMAEVGISLAVAAVPEGLPAVTTLILALGVLRLAREHAIVRRLAAVETLGSATVICADKTGTLTENRMVVREYHLADGRTIDLSERTHHLTDKLLEEALRVGVLCNEASFNSSADGKSQALGDPTETALLVVADELVIDVANERANYPKLGEQPFHSSRRRMTTLHRRLDGQHIAALKGAPTVVLEACSTYANGPDSTKELDPQIRERFLGANEEMASRALRVLALATKHFDGVEEWTDESLETGFTFLGFVAMIDPPRAGVAEAIHSARLAGIRTVMLTGDQLHTAVAIARELDLNGGKEPVALHARDLEGLDQSRVAELTRTVNVFARVSPEDKLSVVEALQENGEVVAVTGDGVNDAPALKRADIGVAMGQRGTEVAKEAADVVLADDNFATIVLAVQGGRAIYANIIKFVHMMFSHNLAEVLTIFLAIIVGWPLPLLPLQILWMNLVTDVFPALALAVEPASPEIMKAGPRRQDEPLFSRSFIILIGWQAVMLAALAISAYAWALGRYAAGAHSRTIALFVLIGVQLGHMFNCRSRTRSAFERLLHSPFIWLATVVVICLQVIAVYFPPLAEVLGTVRLSALDWTVVIACAVTPIIIVEITKLVARLRDREGRPTDKPVVAI